MKLVQLKAEGCRPCNYVNTFLTKSVGEDSFKVVDMGLHENREEYPEVRSVPVVILYNNNDEEIDRADGADFVKIGELVKVFNGEAKPA